MKSRKETKPITAEELDKKLEAREDVSDYFDWNNATKTVNVDMPVWMIKGLDHESKRQGISRQALIKTWLAAKLDFLAEKKKVV
jgi:hypothetical protein